MEYKIITLADREIINPFLESAQNESSCDVSFVNLLIWQYHYKNLYSVEENQLLMRSGEYGNHVYSLPYGNDMKLGMELLTAHNHGLPSLHVHEGGRYDEFCALYGDKYDFVESRDSFDYVYLRESLATLSGKHYHGKRNHIEAFSKEHEWCYEPMTADRMHDVRQCAELWYAENEFRTSERLRNEERAVKLLTERFDVLGLKGGCIYIGDKLVAFTIGSAISNDVFDIHIEKALSEYSGAYTVINREFAAHALSDYTYINREDDLGIDGLRQSKLSYRPVKLIAKYYCYPKEGAKL